MSLSIFKSWGCDASPYPRLLPKLVIIIIQAQGKQKPEGLNLFILKYYKTLLVKDKLKCYNLWMNYVKRWRKCIREWNRVKSISPYKSWYILDGQRLTVFINEAVEARASRSAIKPQNHGIFGWISLRNNEVVEKILLIKGYIATGWNLNHN